METNEEGLNEREQREKLERQAAEIIVDLVCQYAYTQNEEEYFSGGLSVLEDAFIWLIAYGYADGNANHIKLTDKANKSKVDKDESLKEAINEAIDNGPQDHVHADELGGDLYTTWEGREGE